MNANERKSLTEALQNAGLIPVAKPFEPEQVEIQQQVIILPEPIVEYPAEILNKPAMEVVNFDRHLDKLFAQMESTMRQKHGVGISAIQIGSSVKACIVMTASGPVRACNARITEYSEEKTYIREGCLSVPGLEVPVGRCKEITVEYQNERGERLTIVAEGLEARIWQHEIDHQLGSLILNQLNSYRLGEALKKLRIINRKRNRAVAGFR
jgi:peptide deformylase